MQEQTLRFRFSLWIRKVHVFIVMFPFWRACEVHSALRRAMQLPDKLFDYQLVSFTCLTFSGNKPFRVAGGTVPCGNGFQNFTSCDVYSYSRFCLCW